MPCVGTRLKSARQAEQDIGEEIGQDIGQDIGQVILLRGPAPSPPAFQRAVAFA
jgi:hypothetical protein